MRILLPGSCLLAAVLAAGCEDGALDTRTRPPPAELAGDAIGYYCNMIAMAHSGPKGQIFLTGREKPLWFTSVRDTIAFTRLPEEPKNVAAIYVNDMGRASWDQPEPGTWTDAFSAWYVVGSGMQGGMGVPEAVPFAEREAAERFARDRGGRVLAFDAIPDEAVLGAVGQTPGRPERAAPGSAARLSGVVEESASGSPGQAPGRPEAVAAGAAIRLSGVPNPVEPGSAAWPSNMPEAATPGSEARTTGENDVSGVPATRVAAHRVPKQGPEH